MRAARVIWQGLFAVLLAIVVSACSCEGAGAADLPFACSDDAECEAPDWLCRRGECVRADAGCAAALEVCDDGLENDCDALIDCADDECGGQRCGTGGRTCVLGACQCPSPPDGSHQETVCGDGLDDDCDALTDCDDPDCEGRVCDATGLVCGGGSCTCPPAGQDGGQPDETQCADGIDNDCDGVRDCADPTCAARACGSGGICTDSLCHCEGVTAPEASEVSCADGQDNDCDGQVDCADPDCAMASCGASGEVCAGGGCVCSGNGGTSQPGGETVCNDSADNDCDTQVDCADLGCNTRGCGPNGLVCQGTACSCGGNGGTVQAAENICNDSRDNDCDGLTDCQETACAGQACGSNGRVCQGNLCLCSGNGGTAQVFETTCNDNRDNDCDGNVDCADSSCGGRTCGAGNGRVCSGGNCLCGGNGGTPQATETSCNDGHDNDCDGLTDCEDSSCAGRACDGVGGVCSGTACVCGGNGGPPQSAETICNDFADNDCDGLTDCAEAACAGQICGGNGQTCAAGSCECPGNDGAEEPQGELSCGDGFDNDCDGLADCADLSSCGGRSCGANGRICLSNFCACGGNGGTPQLTETTCNDGFDNDCDGLADCLDPDCLNETCGTNRVCCGTTCANLQTNDNHCGGCGLECDSGDDCVAGRCECSSDNDCPLNQDCVSQPGQDYCSCDGDDGNCASGQTCGDTTCSYP